MRRVGYRVEEVVARGRASSLNRAKAIARQASARAVRIEKATLGADLIWLCVPDQSITPVAEVLAAVGKWKGKTVFHSSGALPSSELAPLSQAGAHVASVHPMMTFSGGAPSFLRGVHFAVEGDDKAVRVARGIVRDLGGHLFPIRAGSKPLYHASGSFASPLLVALLATAESVAAKAGIPRKDAAALLRPLVAQTVHNYFCDGARVAFTGPLTRGDVATVRKHLELLKAVPLARSAYVVLARAATHSLPVARRAELLRSLK